MAKKKKKLVQTPYDKNGKGAHKNLSNNNQYERKFDWLFSFCKRKASGMYEKIRTLAMKLRDVNKKTLLHIKTITVCLKNLDSLTSWKIISPQDESFGCYKCIKLNKS